MILEHEATIAAPVDRVWAFLEDMRAVSLCVPGVVDFEETGSNTYAGTMQVQVGPIKARMGGQIAVTERDRETLRSAITVQAADKRLGSTMSAVATLSLVPLDGGATQLRIHTDARILGKLGDFGQAVLRRKAAQIIDEFAANAGDAIGDGGSGPPSSPPGGA